MNRHAVYFLQRVASAATSAAIYVLSDMITQRSRGYNQPHRMQYHSGQNKKNAYEKRTPYQKNNALTNKGDFVEVKKSFERSSMKDKIRKRN